MTKTILLGAVALAACAQTPPPAEEPPVPDGDTGLKCDTAGVVDLVGQPASAELGATALERSHSRTLRWIQPGTAVTMDYRLDRLNVYLDDKNVATKLTCG